MKRSRQLVPDIKRRVFTLSAAAGAFLLLSGHTPYRQWDVYRQRHLLIGTSREDEPSYLLGKRLAKVLLSEVPESSARVTRARTVDRLGSLLSTNQLQVLLIDRKHIVDLAQGSGQFSRYGPTAIGRLFQFGEMELIALNSFPDAHAKIVTETLRDNADMLGGTSPSVSRTTVPLHPGAFAALYE